MDTILADLRYGARRLLNAPLFSTIIILTLALGIGANTAIFSMVDAVLLRPLPYEHPDRLVTVEHYYGSLSGLEAPVSAPGYRDYRAQSNLFDAVAVESGWQPALTGHGDAQRMSGARVSQDFFRAYGVPVALGRPLLAEEDQPGRNHVVVLSDGAWQRLYGGRREAVGQTMILNGEPFQIVGIMPPGYRDFFYHNAELWTPLALPESLFVDANRTNEWLSLTARLRPGITVEHAQREMHALAERLKRDHPDSYPKTWTLSVTSLRDKGTGNVRPALLILLGAVGFVLLIACANVANLLLARGAARRKEIAIRSALGAGRTRIVRQLLAESVMLALAGGALGLAIAWTAVRALRTIGPLTADRMSVPVAQQAGLDPAVLAFALGLSLATGFLFGIAPALQASTTDLQDTLKEGGRSAVTERGGQTTRRVLVVAEVALALVLLAGAGLLVRSVARLQGVDPGFRPERLLTLDVSLPRAKYPGDTARLAYWDELLPRLATIPGVRGVGATSTLPFGGDWSTGSFQVEGYTPPPNQPGPWGDVRVVSPGFLHTLGAPLLKGRLFGEQDGPGAPRVAVVDEEMVKRYWPHDDPIGKRLTFGARPGKTPEYMTVIGVVGHTMHEGLDAQPRVQLYLPYRQQPLAAMSLVVRTASDDPLAALPTVRAAVRAVDADVPIADVSSMEQLIDRSVGQRRLAMVLLATFAGIALVMAAIGIYGVMAYAVTQRAREIGVRMALGAARRSILTMVVRQGMGLVLVGVAIGLAGAFALTRLIASQLYGVHANDPLTFGGVALLLSGVALVATLVPALRATRLDPVVVLRQE